MPRGRPQLFPPDRMRTFVYVDGFNPYYGAVKNTPYKWLDISKMCQLLLPKHQILKIKYFTARVSARASDPSQPTRQQAFLRALSTLPNLELIFGHFLANEVTSLWLVAPLTLRTRSERVSSRPVQVPVTLTDAQGNIHKPSVW